MYMWRASRAMPQTRTLQPGLCTVP